MVFKVIYNLKYSVSLSMHKFVMCIIVRIYLFPCADKNLYTIRAVPFTDIRTIRRHSPAIGWQYVIVVLSSGMALHLFYTIITSIVISTSSSLFTCKSMLYATNKMNYDGNIIIPKDYIHDQFSKWGFKGTFNKVVNLNFMAIWPPMLLCYAHCVVEALAVLWVASSCEFWLCGPG